MTSRAVNRVTQWVTVSGRWTRISRLSNHRNAEHASIVFVMIPGNPGNELFYDDFGRRILSVVGESSADGVDLDFVTVSHLNHVPAPPGGPYTPAADESRTNPATERFGIRDQIQHKADFFAEYLPAGGNRKYVILGHSIGAYIALKIKENLISKGFNVVKVVGLFPTIEQMAVSPNGVRFRSWLKFFDSNDWLLRILLCWLCVLPFTLVRMICSLKLRNGNNNAIVPECVVDAAGELASSVVARNVIHMAHTELETVLGHDPDLFHNSRNILLYYGVDDHWVPNSCAQRQKQRLGDGCVVIDDAGCEHAFVIRDGEIVARNLVALLEGDLKA